MSRNKSNLSENNTTGIVYTKDLADDKRQNKGVEERLASWMRTAVGIMESSHIRVCRVADNMRNVAVTEGDKVEAQIKFGWEVDAYSINEVCEYVKDVKKGDVDILVEEYYNKYDILLDGRDPEEFKRHVAVQAAIEIGFERFLEEKNYQAEGLLISVILAVYSSFRDWQCSV